MHQQYEFDSRSIILMMDGDDAGGGVAEVEAGENGQERIDRPRSTPPAARLSLTATLHTS